MTIMTRRKSNVAMNTKGALLSTRSNNWPPIRANNRMPRLPKNANAPVIVPLIVAGIPRMKRTSILTVSIEDMIIRRQHRVIEVTSWGSFIHMKGRPQRPRIINEIGMITAGETLSPRWPRMGRRQIEARVDTKTIF